MPLSGFHPTIARWFGARLGEPTAPQRRGWPEIRSGKHVLIAAPTGTGKTLAAFLAALDVLARSGSSLPDETAVLYVSPLKALGNDVQKNLAAPLAELRAMDASLPDVRVLVRSGDTPARERAAMAKTPPHVLVTTPESLYILLGSEAGRTQLRTVKTVIVDEIHAVLGDKRGAHLALSLERLAELAGEFQRIGLSATQKPLAEVGRFLAGVGRECELVDEGHVRELDLAVEIPDSPLAAICSHETWGEIYAKVVALVREHRTTLVFVQTRKLAERVAAELAKLLGPELVGCHHSSLSKERRLEAETRLKAGALRALVATASLELGIDIGEVDLAIQLGTPRSIAALLQRIGRAGHGVGRVSKGRLFPLTQDELVEAAALLRAVRAGELDRTPQPTAPLDILAQQIVAACASSSGDSWSEEALFECLRRAWPYRSLARADFDALIAMHAAGKHALLHRDGVHGRVRGTRRAKLVAITSGGAIPDTTQYRVVMEPGEVFVGSVDEDWAIESSSGDVFQLGNSSWRVLRIERGTMRVADAAGAPPSLPFWIGEGPARSRELSRGVSEVRERAAAVDGEDWLASACGLARPAAHELVLYLQEAERALGVLPTEDTLVLERFFDESGGQQLVLHSVYGRRINRALGLALRKRFCRSFGFELQAAANEDAIVISLGPMHAFPLEEVFGYLRAANVEALLVQALLATPLFKTRWRWNVSRALLLERQQRGGRVPPPILRMRADDLLAAAFPEALACGETLPPGDLPIPDHPIVRQTIEDCLREAMDVDGLVEVLVGLESGAIRRVALDVAEPSSLARSVLASRPYGFLDDAPLEERRTQAVLGRRTLDARSADTLGALDPAAVERVRAEAWPDARDLEEVHEALLWMGFVREAEAPEWREWLAELASHGRVSRENGCWFAAEASRDPIDLVRGRLEALGPVAAEDPRLAWLDGDGETTLAALRALEAQGVAMRTRLGGRELWCERRLLARVQRLTLDGLRREIEPVSALNFQRFLHAWQHVSEDFRLEGPAGVREIARQLAGFEAPLGAWEKRLLAPRVKGYRPEWLDQALLAGELAWGRLFGAGRAALRSTPVALVPRDELESWLALAALVDASALTWPARALLEVLELRGALFARELGKQAKLLPSDLERGLEELAAFGLLTSDSWSALRQFSMPAHRRREPALWTGRFERFRPSTNGASAPPSAELTAFAARALLRRSGVIFRALLERERIPIPWRDLARTCRTLELRGEIRGGRFVAGPTGEQFALPEAVALLRRVRREDALPLRAVDPADPLALERVLFPGARNPGGPKQLAARA